MMNPDSLRKLLAGAGVKTGDGLVVHAAFRAVGPVEGGVEGFLDGLQQAVGPEGFLMMPTFTYGVGDGPFDPDRTPSCTGILSERLRQRPGAVRSLHPTHSVTVWGRDAEALTADHLTCGACGVESPLGRAAARNAWVLLIGVSHVANSMIHIGESRAGIRKFPAWPDESDPPVCTVLGPDGRLLTCRLDVSSSCSFAFNALDYPLRRRDAVHDLYLGNALTELMRAHSVIEATIAVLNEYPLILTCTRSDCLRCRRRREYLREHACS